MNIKILANELSNVSPVMILQIGVSECHHNWHGSFELFDQMLELLLNRVGVESTFDSLADLGVLFSKLLNVLSINLTEI